MTLRDYYQTFLAIYSSITNVAITFTVTLLFVWLSLVVSNLSLIWWFLFELNASLGDTVLFLLSFFTSLTTNFTLLSAITTVVSGVLFGVVVATMRHYIHRRKASAPGVSAGSWSLGGVVSAFFGIGCASCGSVLLTSILGLSSAGALLSLLPFHGVEFSFLAILILLATIRHLCIKINDPLVCHVQ